MNKKEIWETFISRIRVKELLFFKNLNQPIGDIFINSTFLKMEHTFLSEQVKELGVYKGTIRDIILDVHVLLEKEEYRIRVGKALDIGIWNETKKVKIILEGEEDDDIENINHIDELMETFLNTYIQKQHLSTKAFDLNEVLKAQYEKLQKENI